MLTKSKKDEVFRPEVFMKYTLPWRRKRYIYIYIYILSPSLLTIVREMLVLIFKLFTQLQRLQLFYYLALQNYSYLNYQLGSLKHHLR